MEALADVAARVVMMVTQGILTTVVVVPIMFLQSLTAKLIGVVIAVVSIVFHLNGTMELLNAVVMIIATFILFGALDSAGSYSAMLRSIDMSVGKAQSVLDMPTMDIDGKDITPANYDIDVENVGKPAATILLWRCLRNMKRSLVKVE